MKLDIVDTVVSIFIAWLYMIACAIEITISTADDN